MGVLLKKSDIAAEWGRHEAAKAAALKAEQAFAEAVRCGRRGAGELWIKVGESVRTLNAEWAMYQRIAPAKMRTKQ